MAFVQSVVKQSFTGATGASAVTLTAGANFGASNLVIVGIQYFSSTSTAATGVTIAGTAATLIKASGAATTDWAEIWAADTNAGGSAAAVISFGTGGHDGFASLLEWSGANGLDSGTPAENLQAASLAPTVSTAATTSQANTLLFAISASGSTTNPTTYTQPSGWTDLGTEANGASNNAGAIAYFNDTGAAGTKTALWAQSVSAGTHNVIAAWKLSAGSLTPPAPWPLLVFGRRNPRGMLAFYQPQPVAAPSLGSVDASSATTDGADALAASVSVVVAASSATTDGADVLASNVSVINAASSATTDGADTLAASVSVIVAASSATTDGADVLAAAVAPIVAASSATTDGADVLAAAVAPIVAASSATTDGADVLLANVDPVPASVDASAAITEGADVLAALVDTGASAAVGGEYGKKKRFTVKRGDELLIFGSKQAALSVLMADVPKLKKKTEPKPEPVPEETIALPEVKAYAEKTGQTETYNTAFDSQQYEKLIAIFEQMRDEEEVELLLLHVT